MFGRTTLTMEVILDGPSFGKGATAKERTQNLHNEIFAVMKGRSQNSDAVYIEYKNYSRRSS